MHIINSFICVLISNILHEETIISFGKLEPNQINVLRSPEALQNSLKEKVQVVQKKQVHEGILAKDA